MHNDLPGQWYFNSKRPLLTAFGQGRTLLFGTLKCLYLNIYFIHKTLGIHRPSLSLCVPRAHRQQSPIPCILAVEEDGEMTPIVLSLTGHRAGDIDGIWQCLKARGSSQVLSVEQIFILCISLLSQPIVGQSEFNPGPWRGFSCELVHLLKPFHGYQRRQQTRLTITR